MHAVNSLVMTRVAFSVTAFVEMSSKLFTVNGMMAMKMVKDMVV